MIPACPRTAHTGERGCNRLVVVVPAYNEERTIGGVVKCLLARAAHVVVVDDGSTDATARRAEESGALVLRHIINRGQGAALQTGIRFGLLLGADIIVTFDADGQHDEADLAALIEPILQGECEATLGSRFLGRAENIPRLRLVLLKLGVWFARLVSRMKVTDVHNGLRAFSARAARSLNITMDGMAHASEVLEQVKASGLPYREVPVNIRYTRYSLDKGQANWNAVKIASQLLLRKISR